MYQFIQKVTETFYVLEGEFIDNGTTHEPGTYFACAPGTVHGPGVARGPHTTKKGCTSLFIQSPGVGPGDSVFV